MTDLCQTHDSLVTDFVADSFCNTVHHTREPVIPSHAIERVDLVNDRGCVHRLRFQQEN